MVGGERGPSSEAPEYALSRRPSPCTPPRPSCPRLPPSQPSARLAHRPRARRATPSSTSHSTRARPGVTRAALPVVVVSTGPRASPSRGARRPTACVGWLPCAPFVVDYSDHAYMRSSLDLAPSNPPFTRTLHAQRSVYGPSVPIAVFQASRVAFGVTRVQSARRRSLAAAIAFTCPTQKAAARRWSCRQDEGLAIGRPLDRTL